MFLPLLSGSVHSNKKKIAPQFPFTVDYLVKELDIQEIKHEAIDFISSENGRKIYPVYVFLRKD